MNVATRVMVCGSGVVVAALSGCSLSGGDSGTPTPSTATVAPTASVAAAVPSQTPAPATVNLAGSWSGQYSGPFNGTFTLTWTQSGSDLNGTINLSSPADQLHISGTLSGSSISFGAVGVVTYTGTVNGNSMSGSYTDVQNGQTGSWSANQS